MRRTPNSSLFRLSFNAESCSRNGAYNSNKISDSSFREARTFRYCSIRTAWCSGIRLRAPSASVFCFCICSISRCFVAMSELRFLDFARCVASAFISFCSSSTSAFTEATHLLLTPGSPLRTLPNWCCRFFSRSSKTARQSPLNVVSKTFVESLAIPISISSALRAIDSRANSSSRADKLRRKSRTFVKRRLRRAATVSRSFSSCCSF